MKILPNENGKADKSLLLISSLSNPEMYKKEVFTYRKVASSSLSRLVAQFQIFRRLMKGKFDAYVL